MSNAIESPESTARSNQGSLDDSSKTNLLETDLENINSLVADLQSSSFKKSIQAVRSLAEIGTEAADRTLVESLQQYGKIDPTQNCVNSSETSSETSSKAELSSSQPDSHRAVYGSAYQILYKATSAVAKSFIEQTPNGIVKEISEREVDYSELQQLLVQQDYQAADKLTTELMSAIAGETAMKRKWVYFTEVSQFPNADILTIDTLWRTYSEDKFGWSQQRNLWLRLGQDWGRLWPQISWKSSEGAWTRYPTEFVWDLDSAPVGHLPLFNQLRGVRVMSALLTHPVWTSSH